MALSRGVVAVARTVLEVDDKGQRVALARAKRDVAGYASDTERHVSRAGSAFSTLGRTAALAAGAAGIGLVAVALRDSIREAVEHEKALAQTNAVIKSTGGIAGVTAQKILDLADAMEKKSGIDDLAIQRGANWLLTFTNVRDVAGKNNDIFTQATKVMTDLAVSQAQAHNTTVDLSSASTMLGKALNDPVKGVTALSKAGLTFTAQQKEQIKALVESGKTMDAQRLILRELEKQVGGSAEAMGTTFAGKVNILKARIGDLEEEVGKKLLPVITKLVTRFSDWIEHVQNSESAQRKLKTVMADVKEVAEGVKDAVEETLPVLRRTWEIIEKLVDATGGWANATKILLGLWVASKLVGPLAGIASMRGGIAGIGTAATTAKGARGGAGVLGLLGGVNALALAAGAGIVLQFKIKAMLDTGALPGWAKAIFYSPLNPAGQAIGLFNLGKDALTSSGDAPNPSQTGKVSLGRGYTYLPGTGTVIGPRGNKSTITAAAAALGIDRKELLKLLEELTKTYKTAQDFTTGAGDFSATSALTSGAGKFSASFGPEEGNVGSRARGFANALASAFGKNLDISSGQANHGKYTVNGNVSEHYSGNAVDIPATGDELTRLGRTALILAGMDPAEANQATGGVYNVNGYQILFNTTIGGNHWNHVHVGVSRATGEIPPGLSRFFQQTKPKGGDKSTAKTPKVDPPDAGGGGDTKPPKTAVTPDPLKVMAIQADRILAGTPLAGLGHVFVDAGKKNGLDPFFLIALAKHESQLGTSSYAKQHTNLFGWGGSSPYNFASWEECIYTVAAGLAKGYIAEGRTSIETIQPKYAPLSDDPLNQHWTPTITSLVKKYGGDPGNVRWKPPKGSDDWSTYADDTSEIAADARTLAQLKASARRRIKWFRQHLAGLGDEDEAALGKRLNLVEKALAGAGDEGAVRKVLDRLDREGELFEAGIKRARAKGREARREVLEFERERREMFAILRKEEERARAAAFREDKGRDVARETGRELYGQEARRRNTLTERLDYFVTQLGELTPQMAAKLRKQLGPLRAEIEAVWSPEEMARVNKDITKFGANTGNAYERMVAVLAKQISKATRRLTGSSAAEAGHEAVQSGQKTVYREGPGGIGKIPVVVTVAQDLKAWEADAVSLLHAMNKLKRRIESLQTQIMQLGRMSRISRDTSGIKGRRTALKKALDAAKADYKLLGADLGEAIAAMDSLRAEARANGEEVPAANPLIASLLADLGRASKKDPTIDDAGGFGIDPNAGGAGDTGGGGSGGGSGGDPGGSTDPAPDPGPTVTPEQVAEMEARQRAAVWNARSRFLKSFADNITHSTADGRAWGSAPLATPTTGRTLTVNQYFPTPPESAHVWLKAALFAAT